MCRKSLETKKKFGTVTWSGDFFPYCRQYRDTCTSITKREERHKETYKKKSEWDSRQQQFT